MNNYHRKMLKYNLKFYIYLSFLIKSKGTAYIAVLYKKQSNFIRFLLNLIAKKILRNIDFRGSFLNLLYRRPGSNRHVREDTGF